MRSEARCPRWLIEAAPEHRASSPVPIVAVPLLEKKGEAVLVMGRKHCGKTIETVAQEDPGYLTWLRSGDRLARTPDDIFFALQKVMEKFGIPLSSRRRRR